jgi:hypothetical protein
VHVQVAPQVLRPGVQHEREAADAAQPPEFDTKLRKCLI